MDLVHQLEQSLYVKSRVGRAAFLRTAYLAYSVTLSRGDPGKPRKEAIESLQRRMEALFALDYQDAGRGLYPRALLDSLPWRDYLKVVPALIADLPRTRLRTREDRFDELPAGAHERYPRYYARNFHFQTDGYLGHTSARLYDLQVEMLFGGTADAMRRRMIPPVVEAARAVHRSGGPAQRPPRILDVACGTGRLLSMLGAALPQASFTGVDLSPHYVSHARRALPASLDVSLLVENGEKLPFEDGRFDAVTCLYLFHELPRDVGQRVLAELVRVVRPGGRVVLGDSIQLCDAPELEAELRAFPVRFHEPYYVGYVQDDLAVRAREAGLAVESQAAHFVTKVVVGRKPEAARA